MSGDSACPLVDPDRSILSSKPSSFAVDLSMPAALQQTTCAMQQTGKRSMSMGIGSPRAAARSSGSCTRTTGFGECFRWVRAGGDHGRERPGPTANSQRRRVDSLIGRRSVFRRRNRSVRGRPHRSRRRRDDLPCRRAVSVRNLIGEHMDEISVLGPFAG